MNNPKILIVEDDPNIRRGLEDSLSAFGYQVVTAEDGAQGFSRFQEHAWDLIILDIMMPEMSGYDLCREMRKHDANTPILFLSAKGEEIDKVLGLELGADDYITKPFGIRELQARIAAILRRFHHAQSNSEKTQKVPESFSFGCGVVDKNRLQYKPHRKPTVNLTAREVKLLEIFYCHPQDALSRDQLLNAAWGIDYQGTTRTLDQHIAQLRKKIEKDPARPHYILTVHGWGYRYAGQ